MSRLVRTICACLAVTLVVALQVVNTINAEHRIEHALQFPGVAYAEAAGMDHDHAEPSGDVDHDADEHGYQDKASTDIPALAEGGDDDGARPIHHHHSGGDIQMAMADAPKPSDVAFYHAAKLGPAPGSVPPGLVLDSPFQPPRQNA